MFMRLARLFMPGHQPNKIIEKVAGIVRARRRLRVVLHRKSGLVAQADAFNGIVVQIEVRYFYGIRFGAHHLGVYPKAVVLARDLTMPRQHILDRKSVV